MDELKEEFNAVSDGNKEDFEALQQFLEYEDKVREAVQNQEGDIGTFIVQLRDGHHRVMGSIKAGEQKVCVNLDKESLEKYKGYYNRV